MHDESTALIPLRARDGSIRAHAIVDAADAEWANQWVWRLDQGYAKRCQRVDGRSHTFELHRELLGLVRGDGLEVDHRNRDKLDNRRQNLRVIETRGRPQMQNVPSHADSTSAHRGVCWDKSRARWMATVTVNGKTTNLGRFTSEEEAAAVVRAARARLMPYAID